MKTTLFAALSPVLFVVAAAAGNIPALVVGQDCAGRDLCTFTVWESTPGAEPRRIYEWRGPQVQTSLEGAYDLNGNLILVDGWGVQVIAPDGTALRAPDFRREYLGGVTLDSSGNQWISVFNFGKERLRKFDAAGSRGTSLRNSRPMVSIDLDADQCSMVHSAGTDDPVVRRYNVCAGQAMQDLGVLPAGSEIRQVRHLPGEDVLVVTPDALLRLAANGQLNARVDSGNGSWRAVSMSPDASRLLAITDEELRDIDLETGAIGAVPLRFASEKLVGVFARNEWRAAVATHGRPNAPSDLRVTWFADGRHRLDWVDDFLDEDYFTIEYSVDGARFRELGRVDRPVRAVTVRGWDPMRYYRFRVRAWNENGASGYSNEKSFWD